MGISLEKVKQDLDFASTRISEQTRTISIGILALVWLFLAGGDHAPVLPSKPNGHLLLLTGALALLALVFDHLQYLFGYLTSDQVRKQAEQASRTEVVYNYDAPLYRARTFAFWAKQVIAMAAVVLLFGGVICALTRA